MIEVKKLRKLYVIEQWMAWGAGEPHWVPWVIWDGTKEAARLIYPGETRFRITRIKTHEEALRFLEFEWDFSDRAVAKLQNPQYEWVT